MDLDQWLAAYRQRDRALGAIPEVQWRMLLLLAEEGPLDVTSLSFGAGCPVPTAIRHIELMCEARWVTRRADPADRRKSIIVLLNFGRDALCRGLGVQPERIAA